MIFKTVALVSLCSVVLTCNAKWGKDLEIGGLVGATNYFGDINTMNPFHKVRPGALIFGRYNYHSQLSFRTNVNFAMLSGTDKSSDYSYQIQRNLEFTSYVFGLSGVVEFNFIPIQAAKNINRVSPYFSIGLGTNLVNKTFERKFFQNIEIPVALGVKINTPGKWTFSIEYSMRKFFRDDLDRLDYLLFDVNSEHRYRQMTVLSNNDWFSFLGIGIAYKLRDKSKCPAFTSINKNGAIHAGSNTEHEYRSQSTPNSYTS